MNLSPEHHTQLACLAAHPHTPFDAHTAAAALSVGADDALEALDLLTALSALDRLDHGRWMFARPEVYEQARSGLHREDERAVFGRVVEDYAQRAARFDRVLNPHRPVLSPHYQHPHPGPAPTRPEALEWFGHRRPTLPEVVDHAHHLGLDTQCWHLAEAMWAWLIHRRYPTTWVRVYETAARAAHDTGNAAAAVKMARAHAVGLMVMGDLDQAEDIATDAYEESVAAGEDAEAASCLETLGSIALGRTRPALAETFYLHGLAKWERLDRERGQILMRRHLAECYRQLGRPGDALEELGQVLAWHHHRADEYMVARTRYLIAVTHMSADSTSAAEEAAMRAADHAHRIGAYEVAGDAYTLLADLASDTGDGNSAAAHRHHADHYYRRAESPKAG